MWLLVQASQPGWPDAVAEVMLPMACGAREAGCRARPARLPHKISQRTRAAGALEPGEQGAVSVYSYERGVARNPQRFATEDAACQFVLDLLASRPSELVRLTPGQAAEGRRLARESVEEFNRVIDAAGGTPAPLPPE